MDKNHEHHVEKKEEGIPMMLYGLIIALVAVMAYNQVQISNLHNAQFEYLTEVSFSPQISNSLNNNNGAETQQQTSQNIQTAAQGEPLTVEAIAEMVIPRGVPDIYGKELGVSFEDPVNSLAILASLDDGKPMADAGLNARYVKIAMDISCEYCCGAQSIIFDSGAAACGCQHSYGMRGLAKYLLSEHGNEYTDEQILEELGKWKTMFFPKQMIQKAIEFANAGKDINTVDLTSNRFRGFKAPAQGAVAANIGNLPDMVGGC